jgi:predicted transcriptional regulator
VTTSLKLSEKLKKTVARMARAQGVSPHAFMVSAIEKEAAQAALRESFRNEALAAAAEVERTGLAYAAEDVHAWMTAKLAGRPARKPKARAWR